MARSWKTDAAAIAAYVQALPRTLGLAADARRAEWTQRAYHFTDVQNAADVLRHGAVYSREECDRLRIRRIESASPSVIAQSPWAHRFARLYFRPRTPTQFHMEGIRPAHELQMNAHCPVPVFFIFDAAKLLGRVGTKFSASSLARHGAPVGDDLPFLQSLPFADIYSDGAMSPGRRDDLVGRRHAEILVEGSLELDDLVEVVCRTAPERETLLFLLGPQLALRWEDRIRLERAGERLFERRGTFLKDIRFLDGRLQFEFEPHAGPFNVDLLVRDYATDTRVYGRQVVLERMSARHDSSPLPSVPNRAVVRLELNDALAFHGVVSCRSLF